MSIKLILAFVLVGLICYILGRLSGGRHEGGGGGAPMLNTAAPRTLDAARAATAPPDAGALDAASLEEIKRLLRDRQLISAIKIYREQTRCSLLEAKNAVESIRQSL